MPYCADFLPLVHDEMLSAARARDAGRRRAGERRRRGRRAADRDEAAVLLRRGLERGRDRLDGRGAGRSGQQEDLAADRALGEVAHDHARAP